MEKFLLIPFLHKVIKVINIFLYLGIKLILLKYKE